VKEKGEKKERFHRINLVLKCLNCDLNVKDAKKFLDSLKRSSHLHSRSMDASKAIVAATN